MVTISNINQLNATKEALDKIQKDYPLLFKKLVDIVNLTRAFHFKYCYMGCLILDEDPEEYAPKYVHDYVLHLYKDEVRKLNDDIDFPVLYQVFTELRSISFSKVSLIVLGMPLESLIGSSSIT